MKKTDLAYMAGIVDGEGCIHIRKKKRNKRGNYLYDLSLSISSTDEWLCQQLKMMFGGTIKNVSYPIRNRYRAWAWQVMCRQAYETIKLILPYLRLKYPQAELAIKFQESKKNKGRKATKEESAIQEAEYLLMRNLKIKELQE